MHVATPVEMLMIYKTEQNYSTIEVTNPKSQLSGMQNIFHLKHKNKRLEWHSKSDIKPLNLGQIDQADLRETRHLTSRPRHFK